MKPTSKSSIVIGSVLAGLQVLTGASALGDVFGERTTGLIVLVIGAVQVGWHTYNQAIQVVPTSAVAAVVDPATLGTVAGPAADQPNGVPVAVVDATTTAPGPAS